ncbi:hypothetical protein [Halomicrobium mukohataei]|uniref:Uncharacterized protein n=1 Tax=Halomicrobium mukohataei (strain ATCC 700874 / DSM 12286 / JCM 9738 / NCIMB 13541) TaxID=485914 RepID=C7NYG0_HALMD|nr:hypothetical protein [Halomicrobium mukohataei]ACV46621.1 conserved hypothetical protein [Halomicrobium mukohataei DSM 12286]
MTVSETEEPVEEEPADEQGEETEEEPADEQGEETEEDLPDIEPDEQADLDGLELDTEAIEEQAAPDDEGGDDSGDETTGTDDPDSEETDETATQPALPDGESWGEQYVTMLALLLGEIAEASDGETGKDAEAIEDLARSPPVEMDDAVDEWLQDAGIGADTSPGTKVAVGTAGLALVVILTETDMAQDAISDIAEDMDLSL